VSVEHKALALATVRARAAYDNALKELVMAINPLGVMVPHLDQIEEVIKNIAAEEFTSMSELEAIVQVTQGRQH